MRVRRPELRIERKDIRYGTGNHKCGREDIRKSPRRRRRSAYEDRVITRYLSIETDCVSVNDQIVVESPASTQHSPAIPGHTPCEAESRSEVVIVALIELLTR